MNKVAVWFTILVILGGFVVLVMNNKINQPKEGVRNELSVSGQYPTPTPKASPTKAPSANLIQLPQGTISATIKTSKGDIQLELFPNEAPNTVLNFIQKAKSGFYKNLIFHRVEDWVIQGGDPDGNGTGGGKMATELNHKSFIIGSLGVARGPDIAVSNDAQFFITKQDAAWLTGQYTNFGVVTQGMDVAQNIQIGDKILDITLLPSL